MARKQYGVAIEVEDSKSELEVTKWSDKERVRKEGIFGASRMFGMVNGESFGVALGSMWPADCGGITMPAYFHSFASTSTSADDCKVMECITGCRTAVLYLYLYFCVSAGSSRPWMCSLLAVLLAYPSSIYAFIYLTFQLHIFAQKRVPEQKSWRVLQPIQGECNVNGQPKSSKELMGVERSQSGPLFIHTQKYPEVLHVSIGVTHAKWVQSQCSLYKRFLRKPSISPILERVFMLKGKGIWLLIY